MPSKYFSQSLPYRRLVEFSNGIWDENRKTFYPWKQSAGTVAAKTGIHYYLKSVTISCFITGIVAAGYSRILMYLGGNQQGIYVTSPQLTQATDYFSNSLTKDVGVLLDCNTAITSSASVVSHYVHIVYAEIPSDPAGGPVVIS